jgi:proton-dependent oligopeptide transporter, POT family
MAPSEKGTFLGHPRGLATLFFTEMWERFSYYGMRALLVLFMVSSVEQGGMGLDDKTGGAIYGLYAMLVYLLALPGGWLADKLFGLRKAVFYGGCIIAFGHFLLALPSTQTFFLGLLCIVMGTGLLKPNISSLVGQLYSTNEQAKRDAGFSIFYMGINLGAFTSPFITGYLGEKINWHYGFAAAGLGMVIGLIQYKATEKYLGDVGTQPSLEGTSEQNQETMRRVRTGLWIFLSFLVVFVILLLTDIIRLDPVVIAQASGIVILVSVVGYFAYIFLFEKFNVDEKKKLTVMLILFFFSAVFWAGYEQQGSSLNLFAKRYTDLTLGGWVMPASWLQSAPPIFVVIFSLVFAWLWVWLAKRNLDPGTPVKFSLGLLFAAAGFAVMMFAAMRVIADGNVGPEASPGWLIMTYLLHTFGEICLYPVGLSAVTKLSPKKVGGQMMGVWFMSLAFGNLIAGLFAGEFDENVIEANPQLLVDLFWTVVKVTSIAGLIILIFSRPIRKLMGNIR